jgi:chitodextrinase
MFRSSLLRDLRQNQNRFALVLPLSILACALAISCAAPGEPSPPHPVVPETINDLSAHQRGSSVIVSFTVPTKSTRGGKLASAPAVDVYRSVQEPRAPANRNPQLVASISSATVSQNLHDGRFDWIDSSLPASSPGQSISYIVRTTVTKSRFSADSNLATLHVFPPPPAPSGLRANLTETTINLSWSSPATAFHIYRCEAAKSAQPPICDPASPPKLIGESPANSFNDAQFAFNSAYIYTVRAVANTGAESLESDDSASLSITPKDIFPPSVPAVLVAAVIPATNSEPARVELSWEINPETDLAGYSIYRSEDQSTTGQKLNSRLLLPPVFRDTTVTEGARYFYRVSAVDRAGNESSLSSAVAVEIPRK